MATYLADILNQADSMDAALDGYLQYADRLSDIVKLKFRKVLFAGMGSSHYCSHGASIQLNRSGLPSMAKTAGEILHYELGLVDGKTLLIVISQSGESAEITALLKKIPVATTVVAVTNNPDSALASRGDFTLLLGVAEEESVTTRTYLASLILVDIIAERLSEDASGFDDFGRHVRDAIAGLRAFLRQHEALSDAMMHFVGRPSCISLMGRGYSHGFAKAGALFIREVAKFPALDFDAGEFRHGHIEMIDEDFRAILFAPEGRTFELNRDLALSIASKGGKCIFVTNKDAELADPGILVVRHAPCDELLAPLIGIVPAQLLANGLALSRGIVPGKFRWCTKVTRDETS